MKCFILAVNHDEQIESLSGKVYLDKFFDIHKNHSIFQSVVAENIPYCDSFIIITECEYHSVIESQMKVFQGVSYKCIFKEKSKKSSNIVLDSIFSHSEFLTGELIFLILADYVINSKIFSDGEISGYKDAMIEAKKYALSGDVVTFEIIVDKLSKNTGVFLLKDEAYKEKLKDISSIEKLSKLKTVTIDFRYNDEKENLKKLDKESMILLSPSFKDYLWGGTKLKDVYNKQCNYDVIAESWELSAHTAGQSIVSSGAYKGISFSEYLDTIGKESWGWKCGLLEQFPLMIKFIDAKENLSIQVHPDDEYALMNENSYGKNEMWYVIDSEPDSGLYVGFNQNVTKEQVEESIKNHTIMELLNFYPTKAGDVFFIPAGTVHAIGAGNLVCEIQQSSNCTYRLYDYDRRDISGNPRELHLKKAMDVLNYKKYHKDNTYSDKSDAGQILSQCKYFKSMIYDVDGEQKIKLNDSTFFSLICLKGNGNIELDEINMNIRAGDSVFIPAVNGELIVSGSTTIILSNI